MENSQAQEYSSNSLMQKEDGLQLMNELRPQKGMKVLDLGCGTGYLASVLAQRVGPEGTVIGVDPNTERVQLAKDTYSDILFQEGSTDNIPEDQYDMVYNNYVMNWVKDKETAFKNVYKNLKPGGSFGVQVVLRKVDLIDQMNELMSPEKLELINDMLVFTPSADFEQIAFSCGFTLKIKIETPSVVKFKNVEEMLDWWYGTTYGVFNPTLVDKDRLEQFKKPFGDKAYEVVVGHVATFIFVKPVGCVST